MKRFFLATTAAAMLAFAGTGCGALDDAAVASLLEELARALPEAGKPLADSDDPGVQAAAAAREAVRKDREARTLVEQALESKEPGLVSEAVALRPRDVSLRFYQAAFMIAYDNPSEAVRALREIRGIVDLQPNDNLFLAGYSYDTLYLEALSRTMAAFGEGSSEWTRLRDVYCPVVIRYKERSMALAVDEELGVKPDSVRYAAEGC